jgi:hypothetical protein
MARARDDGIVWYHHPKYRSAPGEIANAMYPAHAPANAEAAARSRRAAFNNELRYIDRVVRGDADVPEDEPPAQPSRRSSDPEIAYRMWGREQEREASEVAREDFRQGWIDYHRASSIFERKRR